jgi:hypothetical protein
MMRRHHRPAEPTPVTHPHRHHPPAEPKHQNRSSHRRRPTPHSPILPLPRPVRPQLPPRRPRRFTRPAPCPCPHRNAWPVSSRLDPVAAAPPPASPAPPGLARPGLPGGSRKGFRGASSGLASSKAQAGSEKQAGGGAAARWSPRTNNQRPTTRNQHQETNNQKPTMPSLRAGHLAVAIQRDHRSSEGLPDALARLLPRKRGRSHRGADVSVSEQALEPGQIAGRGFDVPSTPRQTAEFVDKEHCRPGLLLVVRGDSLRGRQGTSAFVRRRELAVSR